MYRKIFGVLAVVSLLAACSSTDKNASASSGNAGLASRDPLAGGGDKVFFDFDQAVIRDDARPTRDSQAAWLAKNPTVNVQIAGDCDERGTEEYNIGLGNRRAFAAQSYLAAKGVAGNRISTISYGKDRPIAPGSTEEAWAQNRNAITSVR